MTLTRLVLTRGTRILIPKFTTKSLRTCHHGRNKLSYSNCSNSWLQSRARATSSQTDIVSCKVQNHFLKKTYLQQSFQKNLGIKEGNVTSISRSFATGSPFQHDENLNAVRLLYNLPNYKNLMFQVEENATVDGLMESQVLQRAWTSKSGSNAVQGSLKVQVLPRDTWQSSVVDFISSAYASQEAQLPVTHPKNQEVVEAVLKELKSLTDEELSQVLFHLRFFAPCPSSKDPQFMKVWQAIDKECVSRHAAWSLDYCFVVADLWYGIGLARMSEYHWTLTKKLFRRCDKLSKEYFVRFMFCLNLNRSIPPNANSYDLEYRLYKIGQQLTASEVVIIAMAFFKTQIPIRDPVLLKTLLTIAMNESESLDSISVSAVSKLARYSSSYLSGQIIYDFQEKFIPEIPRLSITACTHLTLTGTNSLSPNKEMIQKVVRRVEEDISDARLKELERLALSTTMFNIECTSLFQLLAEELQRPERADEIRKYGRSLPALLHYLTIKDIFITDLISTVLSKTFRMTYYGKDKEIFQRELLCLDVAADVELPEYNGHRLEPKMFSLIMKKNMIKIRPSKVKVSAYEKFIRGTTEAVEEIMEDKDCFIVCNILPHHLTYAIVYCRDKEGNFVKVPQYFIDMKPHEVKKIESDSPLTYHALLLFSRGMRLFKSHELSGQATLQLRQIRKLGYKPKVIFFSDWEESIPDPLKFTKHIKSIIETDGNI